MCAMKMGLFVAAVGSCVVCSQICSNFNSVERQTFSWKSLDTIRVLGHRDFYSLL